MFTKTIRMAISLTSLTDEEEDIIFHSREAILTDCDGNIWQKKRKILDLM